MTYPTAKIETSAGTFEVELWNDVAPKHCENFMKLARDGFYDGLAFHRVIQDFVIQGGCPNTREGASGMPGTGGPGWTVDAEFNEKEHHEGVLSMARSQDPNSAGSQFFVCLGRNHCQHLDRQYTAFGCVTSGIESVREIGTCDVGPGDEPRERQGIISVTVLSEG